MTTSCYSVDPDSNRFEMQSDNVGDWERSTNFMRSTPEFAADPIGTLVDPEQIIRARAEGASQLEVHQRGYLGAYPPPEPQDIRIPV